MTRTDYQNLADILDSAIITALENEEYKVADALIPALRVIQANYVWPEDLSTL